MHVYVASGKSCSGTKLLWLQSHLKSETFSVSNHSINHSEEEEEEEEGVSNRLKIEYVVGGCMYMEICASFFGLTKLLWE